MNSLKYFFSAAFYKLRSLAPKSRRGLSTFLILVIIPITIIVLQFPQIFRQHAATTTGSYGFGNFGEGIYGSVAAAVITPTLIVSQVPPPTALPASTSAPTVAPATALTTPVVTPTPAIVTLTPTSIPTPTTTPVPSPTVVIHTPTPTSPVTPAGFSIVKAQLAPTIDGNPQEFSSAKNIAFGSPTNNNIVVKAMWDDANLYLAYIVQDDQVQSQITTRDGNVWEDDAVEWFVDTQNNGGNGMSPGDYQGIVNTLNTQFDARGSANNEPDISWNGNWQSAVLKSASNYTVEVRIPWITMGLSSAPVAGTTLGLGFALDDSDASGSKSVMYPSITTEFQNASKWQKVQLAGAPVVSTSISLNLLLHGLGKGGDSANPNGGGTAAPRRSQRSVAIEVLDSQNKLVLTKEGTVNFDSSVGNFKGDVDLGTEVPTGAYTVKVKADQFLKALGPGIQSFTQGQINILPQMTLTSGDMNNDNKIDILDYNTLADCYSDTLPAQNCSDPAKKLSADITDDGSVNQFDYNLFLRELTNIHGQ